MINDDKERGFSEAFLEIRDDLYSAGAGSGQHPLTQFVITTSEDLLGERDTNTRNSFINAIYNSLNQEGGTLSSDEFCILVDGYREHLASRQASHDSNIYSVSGAANAMSLHDHSEGSSVGAASNDVTSSSIVGGNSPDDGLDGLTHQVGAMSVSAVRQVFNSHELLQNILDVSELSNSEDDNRFRKFMSDRIRLLRRKLSNGNTATEFFLSPELFRNFLEYIHSGSMNYSPQERSDFNNNIKKFLRELIMEDLIRQKRLDGEHIDPESDSLKGYKSLLEGLKESEEREVISPSNPGNKRHLIPQDSAQERRPPPVIRAVHLRDVRSNATSNGAAGNPQLDSQEAAGAGDASLHPPPKRRRFAEPPPIPNGAAGDSKRDSKEAAVDSALIKYLLSQGSNSLVQPDVMPTTGGSAGAGNVPLSLNGSAGAGDAPDVLGFGGSAPSSPSRMLRARTPERRVMPTTGGAAGAGDAPDVSGFGGSAFSSLLRNENLTPPSTSPSIRRMPLSSSKDKEPLSPSKRIGNPPHSPGM